MHLSLTKFLILSSILFITACNVPQKLRPLGKAKKKIIRAEDFSPPFQDNFKSLLFKGNLAYGDKFDFGGLLALKQTSPKNYRLVFMAVAGGTLFDFEFGDQGFIIHKAIKGFDRKILLKIIEQDFSLLLSKDVVGSNGKLYSKDSSTVLSSEAYKNCYFDTNKENKKPLSAHKSNKVTINYQNYRRGVPANIDIQHHNVPLSIKLKLLKR